MKDIEQPQEIKLVVGHVYRAKRPKPCFLGFTRFFNDRQIVHLGAFSVQYDGITVKRGQKYPVMDITKFVKWMGSDVTDQTPKGDWNKF